MPGRFARVPRRSMSVSPTPTLNFWETDGRTFYYLTPQICQDMLDQIMQAMSKALVSGVVEYKIGSRGLRRFSMKDLQDLLGFWLNQLEAAMYGGSIVARRSIPTDT